MSRIAPDDGERGMILVNVLLMVAIASGMVMLMINREELALDQALRTREATRALAVARGGEVSAIVALRRDMVQAPDADNRAEPWARLAESAAPIEGGTFDLAIADAQGRYNINNLLSPQSSDRILFLKLARAVGLTNAQIAAVTALVEKYGPITDLRPVALAGIDPEKVKRLHMLVTALPGFTKINLNAAPPPMLTVLLDDPVTADRLVAVRDRQGYLTEHDLDNAEEHMPLGSGFTSRTFWVRTRATIGETSQTEAALIQRHKTPDSIRVATVERWRGASVPPEVPAFAPPPS